MLGLAFEFQLGVLENGVPLGETAAVGFEVVIRSVKDQKHEQRQHDDYALDQPQQQNLLLRVRLPVVVLEKGQRKELT